MRVLFICHGNVARSQMAEALFNTYYPSDHADSAGVVAENPGTTLEARRDTRQNLGLNSYVIDVMDDLGIDVRQRVSTQLEKTMLPQYDIIINMAEQSFTPPWLEEMKGYTYWEVADPMGKSYELTAKARDTIRALLIQTFGQPVTDK